MRRFIPSGPLIYRSIESQRKEETLIAKMDALFVLFRGDAEAVAKFVGVPGDIGHDSVLAAVYSRLSVNQRACQWAQPECLLLFLQFCFGKTHLVVKKVSLNLVSQHLRPVTTPPNNAPRFVTMQQVEESLQQWASGTTTAAFCYPGSPLYAHNPMFFYTITARLSNQFRNTTRGHPDRLRHRGLELRVD